MASHDAIPHGTFPAGTTLYECDARAGDVVVILARGRFRAARVLSVASERARLIYPAERAAALPRRALDGARSSTRSSAHASRA